MKEKACHEIGTEFIGEVPKLQSIVASACEEWSKAKVVEFVNQILHGDEVHKAWLIEAAQRYNEGQLAPPPRTKLVEDNEVNDAWIDLQNELDPGFITDGKTYECGQCGGKGKSGASVKHEEGCIYPSVSKAENIFKAYVQQLRQQLEEMNK